MDVPNLPDGANRVQLPGGRSAFAKLRRGAPVDFFAAEARGLASVRATDTMRVPSVLGVSVGGILLEDLGNGRAAYADWEAAGQALAGLHRTQRAAFGFEANGYCGDSPQDNTPDDDGFRFFSERRLLPQMRRAFDRRLLDPEDRTRVESVCMRLRDLLPLRPPVLIHGDLWSGNLHACGNGELALIDAGAVHFGWAECDLAMLTLFGEPPRAFFAAYECAAGMRDDWRQRAPLLNLYHLLNHLNLFGSGHVRGLRKVLAHHC